jgi:hypothetical protein
MKRVFYTRYRCHADGTFVLVDCWVHIPRKELELVRIYTPMSMSCARELFGITFGVGIRNRAPNKGDNPVTMHHGDIVNLVAVNQQVLVDRDQEFVAEQGIDFLFESFSRSLKIRARYSRFHAKVKRLQPHKT